MKRLLTDLFKVAISDAFGELALECDPSIQSTAKPEFGDYQANFAMRLAKVLNKKPLDIANTVIAQLKDNITLFKSLEVSGPGFINIFIADEFLAHRIQILADDKNLGVQPANDLPNVVVDYSGANVAKEMHIGHIRSIVIGDAIVRVLSFLGYPVIRQSHLGDWGTQFGMLIEYLFETGEYNKPHSVSDLDSLYKKAKQHFDTHPEFADKARLRVVALQSGDKQTLAIWHGLVTESLHYCQSIYDRLDVLMNEHDACGESFYNPMLPNVVSELEQQGVAENSEGATVIFLEGFVDQNAKPLPLIIRKKDGGFLYATSDLAAVKYRVNQLHAQRLIYVTDARQKQHFAMVFAAVRKAGWTNDNIRLEHVPFGSILGNDNKPFKTRSGESIKLAAVLDEAESRAKAIAHAKNPALTAEQLTEVAHNIGIGALKYADLRIDKIKDYVFDWEKMLSFDGNTAPYLQNAYVRILAIFRKANLDPTKIVIDNMVITTLFEHSLAIKILEFSGMIYSVADDLALQRLCDYLFDLAATFHRFYENCPILSTENDTIRNSRLLLADITARVLKLGLELLGIKTLEQM